jgi:hypothetical protein
VEEQTRLKEPKGDLLIRIKRILFESDRSAENVHYLMVRFEGFVATILDAMKKLAVISDPNHRRNVRSELFVFSVGDEAATALQSVRGASRLLTRVC